MGLDDTVLGDALDISGMLDETSEGLPEVDWPVEGPVEIPVFGGPVSLIDVPVDVPGVVISGETDFMFDENEIAEAEFEVTPVDDDKPVAILEIEVTIEADNILEGGEGEANCEVVEATDVPDCTLEVCETLDPNVDVLKDVVDGCSELA